MTQPQPQHLRTEPALRVFVMNTSMMHWVEAPPVCCHMAPGSITHYPDPERPELMELLVFGCTPQCGSVAILRGSQSNLLGTPLMGGAVRMSFINLDDVESAVETLATLADGEEFIFQVRPDLDRPRATVRLRFTFTRELPAHAFSNN